MPQSRKQFVDRKLVFRLRIFAALFIVMLVISGYETWLSYISTWEAILALIIGSLIGYVVGYTANVFWQEETSKAIMKIDLLSGVVLVCYLIFAIFRRSILSHWINGNELSAFVLCMSAGIALGRFIAIRGNVLNILKQQGK